MRQGELVVQTAQGGILLPRLLQVIQSLAVPPREALRQGDLDQIPGHLPLFRRHLFHHRNKRFFGGFLGDKNATDKGDARQHEHQQPIKHRAQDIQPHDLMQVRPAAPVKPTTTLWD